MDVDMQLTQKPKTLRERKKESCRQDIYKAAIELFLQKGYEQTTVDEIANNANVSKATFFNYFPRKEELVRYYANEMSQAILKGWKDIRSLNTPSVADKILAMVRVLVDQLESQKEAVNILLWKRINMDSVEQFPFASNRVLLDELTNTLREGQKNGEIRCDVGAVDLAENIFAIIIYNLIRWMHSGDSQCFFERVSNSLEKFIFHTKP